MRVVGLNEYQWIGTDEVRAGETPRPSQLNPVLGGHGVEMVRSRMWVAGVAFLVNLAVILLPWVAWFSIAI